MIAASAFADAMAACRFDTVFSVPCSSIAGLLAEIDADGRFAHITATSEAEAVGLAAGAYLAGREPLLVMQNSGFCEALNTIASLLDPFEIPLPFLVTGRGAFDIDDEPQHRLIGRNLARIADAFELPFQILLPSVPDLRGCLFELRQNARNSRRGAVLAIPVGTIGASSARPLSSRAARLRSGSMTKSEMAPSPAPRLDAIRELRRALPKAVFVATTGFTGRELFATGDSDTNLYLAGSMGCASAVGLGLALFGPDAVVVLDGDGAMLMRMGNCATIGACAPARLIHVVLNNGVYASTGGQPSLGRHVDLAGVAHACGYPAVLRTADHRTAAETVRAFEAGKQTGPLFIDLWVQSASEQNCPRPTVPPPVQARRLRARAGAAHQASLPRLQELDA